MQMETNIGNMDKFRREILLPMGPSSEAENGNPILTGGVKSV
jgi:hypothetical protein